MGETYYEVLGVDPEATRDEIQAAYRERVLETHPDHNDDPDAAEQFKRVSTARSVLTDGDERARYDRLGHDAYVSLGEQTGGGDASSSTTDSSDSSTDSDRSAGATTSSAGASSERRRGNSTGPGSGRRTGRTWTGTSSDTGSDGDDRGRSHHARQRKRRRRKRAQRRAAGQWPFGSETGTGGEGAERAGATAGTATAGATASDAEASGSSVRYAVHGWDEEIDLEWDGQSLDQSTAVTISCVWLLYPILVVSSLTAAFPAPVNVVVAACTIAIVGYLLTRPRIAIPLFGFWSLVFPLGMLRADVSPVSVIGLIALGFVWVPFGYAVGLWWALRP